MKSDTVDRLVVFCLWLAYVMLHFLSSDCKTAGIISYCSVRRVFPSSSLDEAGSEAVAKDL